VIILFERELRICDEQGRLLRKLALPDGMRCLTADRFTWCVGGDAGVWIGPLEEEAEPVCLDTNLREVVGLTLSSDGQTLAIATGRSVAVWHLPSRQERLRLGGHAGGVCWVGFTADTLLSTAKDGTLHIWPTH